MIDDSEKYGVPCIGVTATVMLRCQVTSIVVVVVVVVAVGMVVGVVVAAFILRGLLS